MPLKRVESFPTTKKDQPPRLVPPDCCKAATCFRRSIQKSLPLAMAPALTKRQSRSYQDNRVLLTLYTPWTLCFGTLRLDLWSVQWCSSFAALLQHRLHSVCVVPSHGNMVVGRRNHGLARRTVLGSVGISVHRRACLPTSSTLRRARCPISRASRLTLLVSTSGFRSFATATIPRRWHIVSTEIISNISDNRCGQNVAMAYEGA